MSIATEITALTADRNGIRTALVNKGVSAASTHGFDDFAEDIEDIPAGAFASIVVTAPTGSTVTCNGAAGTEVSGTWTFSGLGVGTYAIVATDGTHSKTQNVLIDTVGVYNVVISYRTYLYNEGDECTSITGGWNQVANYTRRSQYGGIYTTNSIDFSSYSELKMELLLGSWASTDYSRIGTCSSVSSSGITFTAASGYDPSSTSGELKTITVDISNWTNGYLANVMVGDTAYSVSYTIQPVEIDNITYYQIKMNINGSIWIYNIKNIWLE